MHKLTFTIVEKEVKSISLNYCEVVRAIEFKDEDNCSICEWDGEYIFGGRRG